MAGGPVIIIISPHPNRAVAPEEQGCPGRTIEHRVVTINGLYADPTNGEVAQSLQEALSTLAELNPDDPWSGS